MHFSLVWPKAHKSNVKFQLILCFLDFTFFPMTWGFKEPQRLYEAKHGNRILSRNTSTSGVSLESLSLIRDTTLKIINWLDYYAT
jgi:hypothetical protein